MTRTRHHNAKGIALIEILISIGIFAFAMSAIAGLFVLAIRMQVQTNNQLMADMLGRSAEAQMSARPYNGTNVIAGFAGPIDTDAKVYDPAASTNAEVAGWWSRPDRTFPSDSMPVNAPHTNTDDHEQYVWLPMLRDLNTGAGAGNNEWMAYVFVCDVRSTATYFPAVGTLTPATYAGKDFFGLTSPIPLVKGDQIMDDNGEIYQVMAIDGTTLTVDKTIPTNAYTGTAPAVIYYVASPPPDTGDIRRRSPVIDIIEVTNADLNSRPVVGP